MALSLITKAWPIVMQTGKKFVLVAICDAANDDGECFLCVETIAYKCGMGMRTVQGHLIDLEADNFIWREERLGRSSVYSVNVVRLEDAEKSPLWVKRQLMKRTPAKAAGVPKTPAAFAQTPAVSAEAPAVLAPIPAPYPSPILKNNDKARNCVLPVDFSPNETGVKLAATKGVDVSEELEAFTDHHTANGSTFTDWQAAFRTWIRNAAKFAQRGQRLAPAYKTAPAPRQPAESFAERDAAKKRRDWEEMTGRKWPTETPAGRGIVIDMADNTRRIS